jgi:hypothetical protein
MNEYTRKIPKKYKIRFKGREWAESALTGTQGWCEWHHIFPGPDRIFSDYYGLVAQILITEHRAITEGKAPEWDEQLRQQAQRKYEEHYTRQQWRTNFRKSYL